MEFFVSKTTQTMLSNVLFVWAKQNPDLEYRQGMNEIVAVIAYTCFTENFKPKDPDSYIVSLI